MDQFKAQVAENVIGDDGLIPVEISEETTLYLRVALYPIDMDGDDYVERMKVAATIKDMALVAFSYHPEGVSAEDQWSAFLKAGYTEADFSKLLNTETESARERLGKFRYAG